MPVKSLYYILVLTLCLSCKNEKYNYNPPVFPIHQEAVTKILTSDVMFYNYQQPLLVDSILIIPDVNRDTMLFFYNIHSGELIKNIGIQGKGPGELTLPTNFSMNYSRKILHIFDYAKKSVIRYNIKRILNDTPPFFDELSLSAPLLEEGSVCFLRDSLYLSSNNMHRLVIATTRHGVETNDDYFPLPAMTPRLWNTFLQSWSGYSTNPSGDKYVCATSLGGIIEIYNLVPEIKLSKRLLFFEPLFTHDRNKIVPAPEAIYGFRSLFASDHYIYATVFAKQNPTRYPDLIWLFDWEGNPIASIKCPYEISNFTVDENNKKIYAITYNSEREESITVLDYGSN